MGRAVVAERPGHITLGPANIGATTALNLDGGDSTSLAIHIDGLDLDLTAHRATINALPACAPRPR